MVFRKLVMMSGHLQVRGAAARFLLLLAFMWVALTGHAEIAARFDIGTLCCNCTSSQQTFCEEHFQHLNYTGLRGHYVAMGTDDYRSQIEANGNVLAVYHNDLNTLYTQKTPKQKALEIQQYVQDRFTAHGAPPQWVILNEISAGLWPSNAVYRTWVGDVVTSLHTDLGFKVIIASPFSNPGAHSADWQRVATQAYVGIENYLSGEEVINNGNSVSWCQSQYQSSKTSYMNLGVPASQLYLFENFGQTESGTGWGRAGVSSTDWISVIQTRSYAIQNVGFAGFCSYAWGGNPLGTSQSDMLDFEDTYSSQALPDLDAIPARISEWTVY
jgi:hypothetical protein